MTNPCFVREFDDKRLALQHAFKWDECEERKEESSAETTADEGEEVDNGYRGLILRMNTRHHGCHDCQCKRNVFNQRRLNCCLSQGVVEWDCSGDISSHRCLTQVLPLTAKSAAGKEIASSRRMPPAALLIILCYNSLCLLPSHAPRVMIT